MVGGLGAVEQAEHQALVSIAHGLALGTIAQVGVDTAGKHLLQALVAAVVCVHVGIRHHLGDELVLHGTGSASDGLARKVLDALDGVPAHSEHAYKRLIIAARKVVGLLALLVGAHRHGEGGVIALDGRERGGEVLRLKGIGKSQA